MKYSVWKNEQTEACYIAVDVSNPLRPELICTPYGRYIPLDDAEAEMIVTMLNNQNDKIERLTKAGDALEDWIAWKCESPAGTAEPIIEAWNAAKKGNGQL
jgi:hypothetical protein